MLTRTGLGVLIGTVLCAFFGLLWSYEELFALAAAGGDDGRADAGEIALRMAAVTIGKDFEELLAAGDALGRHGDLAERLPER